MKYSPSEKPLFPLSLYTHSSTTSTIGCLEDSPSGPSAQSPEHPYRTHSLEVSDSSDSPVRRGLHVYSDIVDPFVMVSTDQKASQRKMYDN